MKPSALVDSHCHLDVAEFDPDRDAIIARARDAGVTRQVVPAIARAGWEALAGLCRAHDGLYPAYGLHPVYLAEHRPEHLRELADVIARERPVAIGECGLDYFVPDLDIDEQRRYFVAQLELARDADLPVIVHARRAVDEVIATVRRVGRLRGVVHSYSGSLEQAAQLWKLGFYLGFGGPITYDRATRLRGIVTQMPLEWLLLESDAPDQPLAAHRGVRNEPCRVAEVLDQVAALRPESRDAIAAATTANAERLFRLRA